MGHREWTIRMWTGGQRVRVKKWSDMVEGEVFQEATTLAANGVTSALRRPDNEAVARDLYADVIHSPNHNYSRALDDHAWEAIRRSFERAHYVIVPLHADPDKFGWEAVSIDDRRLYVMQLLVAKYGYSPNAAAGIVGNLEVESGILPDRLEQSSDTKPFRAPSFAPPGKPNFTPKGTRGPDTKMTTFSPAEIRGRKNATRSGPLYPGIGLAQWTFPPRRRGLFQRRVGGVALGDSILKNMDAQVEYLVSEIKSWGHDLQAKLMAAKSVEDACDLIAYHYEGPGAMDGSDGAKLAMSAPQVQKVLRGRRPYARFALDAYNSAQASP